MKIKTPHIILAACFALLLDGAAVYFSFPEIRCYRENKIKNFTLSQLEQYVIVMVFFLSVFLCGGCFYLPVPFVDYGPPSFRKIVPECEGWITDHKGNALPNVRVRMISYGKSTTAYTDKNGHFKTDSLYKWLSFMRKGYYQNYIYAQSYYSSIDFTTIGGDVSKVFGELALFIETEKESFILIGQNLLCGNFLQFPCVIYPYWKNRPGFIYCSQGDKNRKNAVKLSSFDKQIIFHTAPENFYPETPFRVTLNPLDNKFYSGERQFVLDRKNIRDYVITTKYSRISISEKFLQWMAEESPTYPRCKRVYYKNCH